MARARKPIEPPPDDGWRIPEELWAKLAPLIPPGKPHPLGCHNPRVPDRVALDAILYVLRTGCQWEALNYTTFCKKSSAHRRFQEWVQAGVFARLWEAALKEYDQLHGIQWRWQAMDGAMTKAPLGGKKNRPQSHGSCQERDQTQSPDRRAGGAARRGGSGRQRAGLSTDGGNHREHSRLAA